MEVAHGEQIKSTDDYERGFRIVKEKDNIDDTVSRFKEFEHYQKDAINPDHYKNQTSLECIEAMEIIFGRDAVIDFCVCNAWKYIWRWKHKNGEEDLKKSAWYLSHAFDKISSHDDKRFNVLKGMVGYVSRHGITVNKEEADGSK